MSGRYYVHFNVGPIEAESVEDARAKGAAMFLESAMKTPSNLPPDCTYADIERAADETPSDLFTADELSLLSEALRMLWQDRLERIGKFRQNNYQPADVAEFAVEIDAIRRKLGIDKL